MGRDRPHMAVLLYQFLFRLVRGCALFIGAMEIEITERRGSDGGAPAGTPHGRTATGLSDRRFGKHLCECGGRAFRNVVCSVRAGIALADDHLTLWFGSYCLRSFAQILGGPFSRGFRDATRETTGLIRRVESTIQWHGSVAHRSLDQAAYSQSRETEGSDNRG